jgi:hypothetical protein
MLHSSSVVSSIQYDPSFVQYVTFDSNSTELIRAPSKPTLITANGATIPELPWPLSNSGSSGWAWKSLFRGGVVSIHKSGSKSAEIAISESSVGEEVRRSIEIQLVPTNSVVIEGCTEPIHLEVFNEAGFTVFDREYTSDVAGTGIALQFSSGLYFLRAVSGDKTATRKVLFFSR